MIDYTSVISKLAAVVELPDGSSALTPLSILDDYFNDRIQQAIITGVRLSGCILLSSLLWMVARSYRSALFALYQANFLIMLIHDSLAAQNIQSAVWSPHWFMTGITGAGNGTMNAAAAGSMFQWFQIIVICVIFVVQIHAAFVDTKFRLYATIASAIAAFPCIFIWGYYCIYSASHAHKANDSQVIVYAIMWVNDGMYPVLAATATLFSGVLSIKLWLAVRSRARMGIEHMDPLRVLLVMFTQTALIPAILAIVCAAIPSRSLPAGLPSILIAVIVFFLPVGYFWAQFQALKSRSPAASRSPSEPDGLFKFHNHLHRTSQQTRTPTGNTPTSSLTEPEVRDKQGGQIYQAQYSA